MQWLFFFFEARNTAPNKYITRPPGGGGEGEEIDGTTWNDKWANPSWRPFKGNGPTILSTSFLFSVSINVLPLSFVLPAITLGKEPMLCICKEACHLNQNQKRQSKERSTSRKCESDVFEFLLYLHCNELNEVLHLCGLLFQSDNFSVRTDLKREQIKKKKKIFPENIWFSVNM